MAEDQKKQPTPSGEVTGKQDLAQALTSGIFSMPWSMAFDSGVITTGGAFGISGINGGFNGALWGAGPLTATQGSGTYQGTNPYSPPLMLPGGGIPYGLIPGLTQPWPGTYTTYRVMAAHPTLALAMACVFGPILAGESTIEATDDAPSDAAEFIEETILPQRRRIVAEMLKALWLGWRGFERVKELKTVGNGRYYALKKLKPLLPELTQIKVSETGDLAGLFNCGVDVPANKIVVYTYDKDGDYYYGRPRMENCRRSWSNYLCIEDNLYRTGTKTASIIPYVGYPPGDGKDAEGRDRSNYETAYAMAQAMARGQGVVYGNLSGIASGAEDLMDLLKAAPDFAKMSLWSHGTIDMGDQGPAIQALIENLRYYDMLLVRGWLQPERSLLESNKAGSRADSESHTDHATNDSDAVAVDIHDCINEQVIDRELLDNYGPEAVGTVRMKAVPLVDEKKIVDEKILDGILANPQALFELIAHTDMDTWMDRAGIDRNELEGPWDALSLPPPPGDGQEDDPGKFGKDDPEEKEIA